MTSVLGWLSSILLVMTISTQIRKQWVRGNSDGVSPLLFIGQMLASIGFTVYSAILHDWVFIVTNSLMFVSACVGLAILIFQRRRDRNKPRKPTKPQPASQRRRVSVSPRQIATRATATVSIH